MRRWFSYYFHAGIEDCESTKQCDLKVARRVHKRTLDKCAADRVDLNTVSKLLRHASVAMSERYVHMNRGDLKAAAERSTAISTATGVDQP